MKLDLDKTYKAILAAAKERRFVTYGELAEASGVPWNSARRPLPQQLGQLATIAHERGWPLLSAIVVKKEYIENGRLEGDSLSGFLSAATMVGIEVSDPDAFVRDQQQKVFEWAQNAPASLGQTAKGAPERGNGPRFVQYFGPVLDALRDLGDGSAPDDVYGWIKKHMDVPSEEISSLTQGGQSKFENKVGWARFYLAKAGLVDGSKRGEWSLTAEGRETHLDHESALRVFREVQARFKTGDNEEEPAPEPGASHELFADPNRRFWFAGASWEKGDQLERFLREGIWQNGYEDKFSDLVAQIKPGDMIAIKAAFVQRYNVPFDVGNKKVSCMRIKAIGTVTERLSDGRTVKVDWNVVDPPRDWYFYTYLTTLVEADPANPHARRVILFAFGGVPQDYDYWLRQPYWARKYGEKSTETKIDAIAEEETEDLEGEDAVHPHYGVENIIEDGCFFPQVFLENALQRLRSKKNLILQGPPGTGKTWLAKRLAYALIGSNHRNVTKARMRIVQFHPSLSYEDFVRGWRPQNGGGLALVDGIFLEAIQAAAAEPDRQFVLIVEEINRGNPAQIFGELLTLLEDSKRRPDEALELAYRHEAGERIFIPPNLHVIGTMNIADRSLALVDLALRRRFAFLTLEPQLGDAWRRWCIERCGFDAGNVTMVEERLTALNKEISEDRSLGSQYRIGHSYVTPADGAPVTSASKWFRQVVETEIAPLLEEYWFDAQEKADKARKRLLADLPE